MRQGRRAIFRKAGTPLEFATVEVAEPGPGAVLVRTVIAGVCGTDGHRLDGDLPAPPEPVCFGHEGIGVIEALGTDVVSDSGGVPVRTGDTVYWQPSNTKPGAFPVMGWPPPAHLDSPAAYQDYALLPPNNVFHRIPTGTSPEAVIAFGCAMPTALGGMARSGGVRPGQSVVVQGCGPVGLASTMLASLSFARQIIVIGEPASRRAAAERLGASTVISLAETTEEERKALIWDLTDGRGADLVIEATGRINAFDEGISLLADQGRYLVLGLYSGHQKVSFDPIRLNNHSLSVIGSMGPTTLDDYRTTVHLMARHSERLGIADLVTHRFGLRDLEAAIAVARDGVAIKAIVLPDLDK